MDIEKRVKAKYSIKKITATEMAALVVMLQDWRRRVESLPNGRADANPNELHVYVELYYAYYGQHPVWDVTREEDPPADHPGVGGF